MGKITFEGQPPFEMPSQKEPKASAEGEIVVVTLPVSAAGTHPTVVEIRVLLSIEHAEYLREQLQPALTMAKVNLENCRSP